MGSIEMTAATPNITPNVVKSERNLCTAMLFNPICKVSEYNIAFKPGDE
jgi:hypothetical protein